MVRNTSDTYFEQYITVNKVSQTKLLLLMNICYTVFLSSREWKEQETTLSENAPVQATTVFVSEDKRIVVVGYQKR
ncbi:unnamed protein product [Litomosoides sigmodontis]|uniref:Uncharacterized protein n=1 Tax=Litomosoides sigmodontis TaxID=42156 RepID=A0A3P6V641_LITSI|nr:unnamed protein product [Litomosoides sigmodontis]